MSSAFVVPAHRADPDWWRSQVVYQIYPRSFADSDGDGIGDLRGIIDHLDHLADLGVGVVWLSPIYRSPQDDNGYDISDYTDVDPMFGSLADLDELIAGLHERGIALVMDLVVNHTSDEHPWFVESRDPDSPKRDWYWWRPPRVAEDGTPLPPTNWESAFSGSAWEFDEASGEYYLHLFSRKQPDLNWENPEVRKEIHAMMRWWLDRGVDGFRMDVINFISKTEPLVDGPEIPGRACSPAFPMVADGPRMHEFLHEMYAEVLAGRNLITVGEMPGVTVAEARRYTAADRHELDMVFTFEHVALDVGATKWDRVPISLPVLKKNLASWQEGLADEGWNSLYWDNHDQPRAVSRFGDDAPEHRVASAKTLATVLHLHRGTPYVYQGQEIGMTNAGFTEIGQYRDIEALNHHAEAVAGGADPEVLLAQQAVQTRDNARTPMQWDDSASAGFSSGTPWIGVNPNHTEINVAAQAGDPDSVLAHYRELIALRRSEPAIVDGRFELRYADDEQLWVFTRSTDTTVLTVLANCSSDPVAVPTDLAAELTDAELLLGTHDKRSPDSLQPWESRLLRSAR
ncbi:alpha-glucosidase [Enemella evansiae]|uniref:alpha-glucosidase n=1 Tax=Enemella evansiae TaxID=2016499 RepID=UPI000B95EC1D|nr:alpha-glucosidase [Enemella evansiae]OYO03345.1 glucohydrolase [Enemella evansiae]TDO94304.1 oligo-1,6-glucosidase [Enemella evansiae]